MGLTKLYNDIKAELEELDIFKYIGIWNNQLSAINGDEGSNDWISIQYPSAFIQINVDSIETLSERNQLWNVVVDLHLIDEFLMGEQNEENTRILNWADTVWNKMNINKIDGMSVMHCVSNVQDFEHSNVYHYVQSYEGNYYQQWQSNEIIYTGHSITISGNTLI